MKPFAIRRALVLPLALLLVAATAAVAWSQATGTRVTRIASAPDEGTVADGASDNTTFSTDNRNVRLMAFDSEATNLAPGDSNEKRDVFVLKRSPDEGSVSGQIDRVSIGPKGQGNGDSIKPSVDGAGEKAPRCVVFETTATNLDSLTSADRKARRKRKLDKASDSDVYLRDLKARKTMLISVTETNATNGVVDNECEFVTFESRGRIFVRDLKMSTTTSLVKGTNPDQQTNGKAVAYERGGQIYYQKYFRKFRSPKLGGPFVKKDGKEVLASEGARGPGNGVSRNPSLDDNGFYVAFESTATNLCLGLCTGIGDEDRNGPVSDIFRKTLDPAKAPTKDNMQMVSFSCGATTKGDPCTVNAQGDGPSNNPAMTGAGENIVFDSEATNFRQSLTIRSIDPNGATRDIYYWNYPRDREQGNVSRESKPDTKGEFNGASVNPSASNRANFIGFTSVQTGQAGEGNGPSIADVFLRFLGGGPEGTSD